MIPYIDLAAHHAPLKDEILDAVSRVLDHGQFILGPEVNTLEQRLAEWVGCQHVIGVNSGTDALILSLLGHGIGAGDEVITVSHSFFSTAAAICNAGAKPVFIDIDEESMLLDPDLLEDKINDNTKAVIPVHLNGYACDMEQISAICEKYNLIIIEDCAQAFGTTYHGKHVGSEYTGCFSMHPLKLFSACGDAGFISTNNNDLAEYLRQCRNVGLKDRDHCAIIGTNSRLDTVQAAILLSKLPHVTSWIESRKKNAITYTNKLSDSSFRVAPNLPLCEHNGNNYVVRHSNRDAIISELKTINVDIKVHYPIPIHQQGPYRQFANIELPVTDKVVSEIVSLPLRETLNTEQIEMISNALIKATE